MVCVDKYMHKTYYMLIGLMVFLLPQAFILPNASVKPLNLFMGI